MAAPSGPLIDILKRFEVVDHIHNILGEHSL